MTRIVLAFLVLFPSVAQAMDPLARNSTASYVSRWSINLTAGKTYTIEVDPLDAGEDTVMHLWYPGDQVEVAQDDDSGVGLASKIVYTVPSGKGGWYTVITRAYSDWSYGYCAIRVKEHPSMTEVAVLGDTRFAGHIEPASCLEYNSWIHSVITRDGANDLFLFLMVYHQPSGLYKIATMDDDSDVEYAARITVPTDMACYPGDPFSGLGKLLVATYGTSSREGATKLYFNDINGFFAADDDDDGLENALEQELGLCWTPYQACPGSIVTPGEDCSPDHNPTPAFPDGNPQDTDGDGLPDNLEVLGKDDPIFPQLLPKWGADPRRMDVFLEIDQWTWGGRPISRLSEADAGKVAQRYSDLGVQNPDGSTGIRVHMDTGQACGSGADGITDVCGNFCAFAAYGFPTCGETIDPNEGIPNWSGRYSSDLSSVRQSLFHWMLSDAWNPAGQGYCIGVAFTACPCWPNIAHELGHNVGLTHGGNPADREPNCKPNYPSLMNYIYAYELKGSIENISFSDGRVDATLDPLGITETQFVGVTDNDISYLETKPLYYDLYNCQFDQGGVKRGCQVDWNRDGQINTQAVRSFVSPAPHVFTDVCGGDHANALESALENTPDHLTNNGAAGATFAVGGTSYLYLFTSSQDNPSTIKYSRTNSLVGGWSTLATLGGATFRQDTQPAAEVFTVSGQNRLYVFATDSSASPVRYAYFNSSGTPSSWSAIPSQPGGLGTRDVSTAVFNNRLYVVTRDYLDTTKYKVYLTSLGSTGTWAAWKEVKAGAAIKASATPAIAAGPDGYLYMFSPRKDNYDRLQVYRMSTAERWSANDLPDHLPWPDVTRTLARPALRYAHHLDASGTPLPSERGYLFAWWHYPPSHRLFTASTWGAFTSGGKSVHLGHPVKYEAKCFVTLWSDGNGDTAPALALRGERVEALLTPQAWSCTPPVPSNVVRHVGYADGIGPATPATDTVDGAVIQNSLCLGLNPGSMSRCGDFNSGGALAGSGSVLGTAVVGPCLTKP